MAGEQYSQAQTAIAEMEASLQASMQELGHTPSATSFVEQFERLLVLGESACAPQLISHLLVSKLGKPFPTFLKHTALPNSTQGSAGALCAKSWEVWPDIFLM